jgi:hypothetical protein
VTNLDERLGNAFLKRKRGSGRRLAAKFGKELSSMLSSFLASSQFGEDSRIMPNSIRQQSLET